MKSLSFFFFFLFFPPLVCADECVPTLCLFARFILLENSYAFEGQPFALGILFSVQRLAVVMGVR